MSDQPINILLRAKDQASKIIRGVRGELKTLERIGGKAVRNLTTNLVRLGAVGVVGLAGAVTYGARSLEELERIANQTEAVIASTGGAAGITAAQIRDMAQNLEALSTADDKAIQGGQNLLLTFTNIGKDVFPQASEAMVNLAIAMAQGDVAAADFKGTALQVGKALNDPVRGFALLRRAGVSFTKTQEKQIKTLVKSGRTMDAQKLILGELENQFGQAGEAAGKGFGADMRRAQDAAEDASQALARGLLPVISRASVWLQRKLGDQKVLAALDSLGQELANIADGALNFIEKADFTAIGQGLTMAKDAAKSIVGAFLSLPPWVQAAVVSGWGLNKLTGGALSDLVGAVGSGLIKGVLGMNAGVVNIRAGSVVGGGVGGGVSGGGGRATAIAGGVSKVFLVGAAVGIISELWGAKMGQTQANLTQGNALGVQANSFAMEASFAEVTRALDGIHEQQRRLNSDLTPEAIAYQLNIDGVRTRVDAVEATLQARLRALESSQLTALRTSTGVAATGFASVRGAINAIDFAPRITIPISLSTYVSNKSITTGQKTIARYGQVGHL